MMEHPTARIADPVRGQLAADIARVCGNRRLAALIITNDDGFAKAVADRNCKLDAASGTVRPLRRGWFGG